MNSTPPAESEKQRLLRSLNDFVLRLFIERNDPSVQKIFKFVQRTLYQFQLTSSLEVSDIITEAYMRIRRKILLEEPDIDNFPGYLKSCCYNIIREKKKEYKKFSTLKQKVTDSYLSIWRDDSYDDLIKKEATSKIIELFSQLSEIDKKMMVLRIFEGLSWREISTILQDHCDECGISLSEQSLRKRGSRILNNMRESEPSMNLIVSLKNSYEGAVK